MADTPQGKKSSKSGSRGSSSTATWIVLAFSAIILIAFAFFMWQRISNNVEFVLVKGDESVLVMLAPETLHVSVTEVALMRGGEEVVLEKNQYSSGRNAVYAAARRYL